MPTDCSSGAFWRIGGAINLWSNETPVLPFTFRPRRSLQSLAGIVAIVRRLTRIMCRSYRLRKRLKNQNAPQPENVSLPSRKAESILIETHIEARVRGWRRVLGPRQFDGTCHTAGQQAEVEANQGLGLFARSILYELQP